METSEQGQLKTYYLWFSLDSFETDIKKLKADLQASRQTESVLRSELNSSTNEEHRIRSELEQLKRDNDTLQTK